MVKGRWCGIGHTPDLGVGAHDRFAGVDVEDLQVEGQSYTLLVFGHIFTDVFAGDPVWALCHLGGEDARGIAGEEH